MKLDLTSFSRAIASLTEGLNEYAHNKNDFIRDACIQRFEHTYELAWKMLKRYLATTSANPVEVDEMSFQNLIRTGSEKSLLLSDWETWSLYRKARSTTSHAYNEIKAQEVFAQIPGFLVEAQFLLKKLQAQNLNG